MKRHSTKPFILITLAMLAIGTQYSSAVISYNAATQFSIATNPNGVWSYGYSNLLGGTFHLNLSSGTRNANDYWETNISNTFAPVVFHNPAAVTNTQGSVSVPAGGLVLHPGPDDEISIVRFTTPSTGLYHITGSFVGDDLFGTTTDVHLLNNGSSIFNGAVNGFGAGTGPSFDLTVALSAGTTFDFAVGYGSDGDYSNDSTGLSATITAVPEPATWGMGAALFAVAAATWLHRKRLQA